MHAFFTLNVCVFDYIKPQFALFNIEVNDDTDNRNHKIPIQMTMGRRYEHTYIFIGGNLHAFLTHAIFQFSWNRIA